MGIEATYRSVSPQEFERLLTNSAYAARYFGDDLDTEEDIEAYVESLEASDRYLDLGKDWRSLYCLLTEDFSSERSIF
jgi:hypothetical protein